MKLHAKVLLVVQERAIRLLVGSATSPKVVTVTPRGRATACGNRADTRAFGACRAGID
jgi:hypothetical protein